MPRTASCGCKLGSLGVLRSLEARCRHRVLSNSAHQGCHWYRYQTHQRSQLPGDSENRCMCIPGKRGSSLPDNGVQKTTWCTSHAAWNIMYKPFAIVGISSISNSASALEISSTGAATMRMFMATAQFEVNGFSWASELFDRSQLYIA